MAALVCIAVGTMLVVSKYDIFRAASEGELFSYITNDDMAGGSWSVTGLTAAGNGHLAANSGTITIPSLHEGKQVTRISGTAFKNSTSLVSVSLPEGLINIEFRAFSQNRALTSINIPASVELIRNQAFAGCDSLDAASRSQIEAFNPRALHY